MSLEDRPLNEDIFDPASEAREHDRKPLKEVLVTNPVPAQVVNISATGMGVESRAPMKPTGQSLFTLASGRARAKIMGRVRWCKLAGTKALLDGEVAPLYLSGIEFVDDVQGFVRRNAPIIHFG